MDPGNPLGPRILTGKGKIVFKQSDGPQIIHEGTWGPMDPQKSKRSMDFLTGQGRIGFKQSDGSQRIKEGTWGPMDPENPKGTWGLTGKGRRVKENGSKREHGKSKRNMVFNW